MLGSVFVTCDPQDSLVGFRLLAEQRRELAWRS